jgi:hypothetical protein
MKLKSILSDNPFCVGFKVGNRFLEEYEKRGEITQNIGGHQILSERALSDKHRYVSRISNQRKYNNVEKFFFKFGFWLGSD